MNWINNQLAIGDIGDLDNTREHTLRTTNVQVNVKDAFKDDRDNDPIPSMVNALVDTIKGLVDDGLKVMIYCDAGMDRSPFIAAAYLVKTENMTYADAYAKVQRDRPQTITHFEWAEMMQTKGVMSKPIATDKAVVGEMKSVELKLKPKDGKKFSLDLGDASRAKDEDIK
jgi:protein-tyrosine phosphatase